MQDLRRTVQSRPRQSIITDLLDFALREHGVSGETVELKFANLRHTTGLGTVRRGSSATWILLAQNHPTIRALLERATEREDADALLELYRIALVVLREARSKGDLLPLAG
jgi:hypothetical protein